MISTQTGLAFFLASVLLALLPGPDNLFVLMQSALSGWRAGILVTLGLCTGLIAHSTAVALGIAAIFQSSALAFNLLKTVGACYLIYLAWQLLRADPQALRDKSVSAMTSKWRFYRRGIVLNITNPKVSIFFLAFLPQFADPRAGELPLQIFVLGGIFIVATLLVFGGIAVLSGVVASLLTASAASQRVLNRVAALVFVALAIKLLAG
jgi:threonine/homoserine/homoserine lactone efflux protein